MKDVFGIEVSQQNKYNFALKGYFMKHFLLFISVSLGALLMAGCFTSGSSSQRDASAMKRTYLPMLSAPEKLSPKPLFAAARLRAFSSTAPYDTTQWVIRRANGETVFDFYTSWIVPPQEILGGELVEFLNGTGLFEKVYSSSSGVSTRLGIEGQITRCLLDCSGAKRAATVGIRILILDENSPVFTVLASAEESARIEIADESTEDAAAKAFGQAFSKAFGESAQQLAKAKLPK